MSNILHLDESFSSSLAVMCCEEKALGAPEMQITGDQVA